jgi:tight adherence protein B
MSTAVVAVLAFAVAAAVAIPEPPRSLLRRRLGSVGRPMDGVGRGGLVAAGRERVRRAWRRWRRRHRPDEHDASMLEVCDILAAELRAGRDPTTALAAAAVVRSELETVARVSRLGGNVAAALREAALREEAATCAASMDRLATAWTVATTSGAGLAVVLDRVAAEIRVVRALRHEVAAQLAGPRASARLLAALPLLGVAVGWGAGTDPLSFLLGTPVGFGCLVVGGALAVLGLVWVERLAKAAEPGP